MDRTAPVHVDRVASGADRWPGRGVGLRRARVLIVDDDEDSREAVGILLGGDGFEFLAVASGEAALAEASRALPDVVLTDLQMRPVGGLELCRRLHEIDDNLPVIVVTGASDLRSALESFRAGAQDYLVKPLQYDTLVRCVERAIARRASKREQDALYRTLNERLVLSSIREQEHAEAEARQRAQLNTLLENLEEGVVIADSSGRILMVNAAARGILGFRDEDLGTIAALNAVEVHDLEGRPLAHAERPIMRALRGEHFVDQEVLCIRPSGERRRVASTGTCVKADGGDVALAIVVFRDVTELKRLEQQRDEYVSLITHDLRSPLGAILLSVGGIKRSMEQMGIPVSPAERVERNVARMKEMLDELTEATSLESHGVALQRLPLDLRKLVASVVDGMGDAAVRRITIDADDALPYVVLGDRSRLERVVGNLLGNALKYSAEEAPVSARFSRTGNEVELDVIDRGIGISPDDAKMLFHRYYRARTASDRASGLGLGLYIARLIVEAQGGRIDVSSALGQGSTFRVFLPSHSLPKPSG